MNLIAPTAPLAIPQRRKLARDHQQSACARLDFCRLLSRVWLVFVSRGAWASSPRDFLRWASPPGRLLLANRDPFQLMLACLAAGRLHVRKGDIDLAISFLEKCREAQPPRQFRGLVRRPIPSTVGYAYLLGGRLDEAVALLTEAIEQAQRDEVDVRPLPSAGIPGRGCLARMGRTEEALQHRTLRPRGFPNPEGAGHEAYVLRLLRRDRWHVRSSLGRRGGDSRSPASRSS